jgi:hypothetical protein
MRLLDGRPVQTGLQLRQATGAGWTTSKRGVGAEREVPGSGSSYNDIKLSVLLDLPKAKMALHPSEDEKDRLVKWQSASDPAFRSCTPLASDHP